MYNVGCIDVMCSSVMELNVDANMIMLPSKVLYSYDSVYDGLGDMVHVHW